MNKVALIFSLLFLLISCKKKSAQGQYETPAASLFSLLSFAETGISFTNQVTDDSVMNIFNYRNFYNGAGVAIGDINNDGLADIFFTANQNKNKLYLNKGNFKFEDISEKAGINIDKFWSTGVTMVDINADGFLDIYVCNAGDAVEKKRINHLFINNKNNSFTEKAADYNLQDDGGYHTHAAFFDFDCDGDLDCYLLNNSSFPVAQVKNWDQRQIRDKNGGDKMLQNNNNKFIDFSEKAGIYGSLIGFGLGVSVGDLNGDMWPDIYISNDFFEKDYLYINQKDGTFKEDIDAQMQHTSQSSMGADMADINNDGLPDIFSTDMLPEGDYRLKTMTKFDDYDFFNTKLKGNLHRQFLQNCLQLNNGDNTFSEIAQLAGVNATDWSWSALMFDFNNDGWKDIFVSNGIYRDVTNQDYIDFLANENVRDEVAKSGHFDVNKFVDKMKSTPLANYGFLNEHKNFQFSNQSYSLGLAKPSFSNGAAYADLDNDGDLDLVVNNVNMESFVYKNNAEKTEKNNYIKFVLQGNVPNTFGIGARIKVFTQGQVIMVEQQISRGFQSSVDPVITMGIGKADIIDSAEIVWPDFKKQVLKNIGINQVVTLKQNEAKQKFTAIVKSSNNLFTNITTNCISGDITHKEDAYIDFDKERLMPKMLSTEGPKIAVGDLNGDGLEDFCIGGAAGDITKLFFQTKEAKFTSSLQNAFMQDKDYEDTGIEFGDIDNDGDLDIIIASGGNTDFAGSVKLVPRIYINDGKGGFYKGLQNLPFISCNASCIRFNDFNGDGFQDIFIGGRNVPGQYGVAPSSFLLQNNGAGNFIDVTKSTAPQLLNLGMVTDAQWADLDNDGKNELIIAGDWMPVTILKYNNSKLSVSSTIKNSNGWWNCVQIADMNGDGLKDIAAGNWGYNSKLVADSMHPAKLYVSDFDNNGQVECIPTYYKKDGLEYAYFLRGDITAQMPSLKKTFLTYEAYAGKTVAEIFSKEQLLKAKVLQVTNISTSLYLNRGNNNFSSITLPIQAQVSSMFSILMQDINSDGNRDIILAGNFFGLKPELGRMDACYGLSLVAQGNNNYMYIDTKKSGFYLQGEVRDIKLINTAKGKCLLVARNNEAMQVFKLNKPDNK